MASQQLNAKSPSPGRDVSPVDSPMIRRAAMSLLLGVPDSSQNDSIASWSMDDLTTDESSSHDSPGGTGAISPEHEQQRRHSVKRCKNELWAAIRPDFMYLMDEEIIDACKSTESELSSDDVSSETKVSYNEFLQQYKELTDWLGHIQMAVSRQTASLSENYLNQMYHEEMLKQSPRQHMFNDYARELLHRFPQLKTDIISRQTRVNDQWYEVMDKLVLPSGSGQRDLTMILNDIEKDIMSLRLWVNKAEKTMASLCLSTEWSMCDIQAKLIEHQAVQKDIESMSRVVSAVMKLCEWMNKVEDIGVNLETEYRRVHIDAVHLEQRWHEVWIQSVEWQVRLEDALSGNCARRYSFNDDQWITNESNDNELGALKGRQRGLNFQCELTDGAESDVIPFHGSEYEEISENDDVELLRNDLSSDNGRLMLDDWMETELCDHEPSDGNVSAHELNSECDETKSFSRSYATRRPIGSNGHEMFDIGYSSESHSYDDREINPDSGIGVLNVNSGLEKAGNENAESSVVVGVGRHSVTSAYNSASDLSDSRRPIVVNELMPTSYYYHTAPVDTADQHTNFMDGCCTDDDFSKIKELSFDDIPMIVLKDDCEGVYMPRRQGRSLDSLMPYSNEQLFKYEQRVSSIEIIMDSLNGSKEIQPASDNHIQKSLVTGTGAEMNGLSSCDASSEGTLSESECSESIGSEDDNTPRKYRLARRTRRRHESSSKRASTGQIKSPLKRHGDSLTDVSDVGEINRFLRSSSDGAICDLANDHSAVKRSKVCRTKSEVISSDKSPKSGRNGRRFGTQLDHVVGSKRNSKAPVRLLKFETRDDVNCPNSTNNDEVHDSTCDQSIDCQMISVYNKAGDNHSDAEDSVSFTDDLSFDISKDESIADDKIGRGIRAPSSSTWQDSDSDMDDFVNIVTESRKAFTFTESTLSKFSKDHAEGVVRDPIEFMGPLATCQTNINCMLELVDALQSGTRIRDADTKIQQINNIVTHWQQLEGQTVSQQQQCRLLYIMYTERIRAENQLKAMLEEINPDKFEDLKSLELTFRTVQAVRNDLQTKVDQQLKLLQRKVDQFKDIHSDVDMTRFSAAVEKLQETAVALIDLCNRKESHLKKSLMVWYQLTELQSHLEYVLADEEHQLDCLDVATDIVHLTVDDSNDTVADLQLMRDSWSTHSDKLQLMESLRSELVDVCTTNGLLALESSANVFSNRLETLQQKCHDMIERMTNSSMIETDTEFDDPTDCETLSKLGVAAIVCDENIDADKFQQQVEMIQDGAAIVRDKLLNQAKLQQQVEMIQDGAANVLNQANESPALMKVKPRHTMSSNTLRRLLRYVLPLPLLLMFIFGGLYLLCDDWFEQLDQFGLWIAPQLRHVRGAPPV